MAGRGLVQAAILWALRTLLRRQFRRKAGGKRGSGFHESTPNLRSRRSTAPAAGRPLQPSGLLFWRWRIFSGWRNTAAPRASASAWLRSIYCRHVSVYQTVMPWTRIALAVLASGIVSSMTDWLFMGDWLYKRYDKHPEIWRYRGGQGETRAIVWASLLPFLTCSVLILVCARLHLTSYGATLQ